MAEQDATAQRDQFLDDVFPAELREIAARRRAVKGHGGIVPADLPRPDIPTDALPRTELGLVGLALSGGGIRSASFCLGVVQSLVTNRVMPKVDYVSSVSGGGYIGACLDTVMSRPHVGPTPEGLPLHFKSEHGRQAALRTDPRGASAYSEPAALRHLRDGARYLAPGGLMDLVIIPFLLIRGITVNLIALLCYTCVIAAGAMLLFSAVHAAYPSVDANDVPQWSLPWVLGTMGIIVLGCLLFTILLEFWSRQRGVGREKLRGLIASIVVIFAVLAAVAAQPWAVAYSWDWARKPGGFALPAWITAAGIMSVAAQALSLFKSPPRWVRIALITILGLLAPIILYVALLLFCGWLWYGSQLPPAPHLRPGNHAPDFWKRVLFSLALVGVAIAVVLLWLDVNRSSMLYFYRDRLSRLFLFRTRAPDAADPKALNCVDQDGADDIKLSGLNPEGTLAPYHLINAAVNLQGSKDSSLRGRMADFFMFSKHFVGSPRTGYCPTPLMEAEDPDLDLATAAAVSAAAAAPNMGSSTFRPLVFAMTLLNVRLGYWLPNPAAVLKLKDGGKPRTRRRSRFAVGLEYLARELFSNLDEEAAVVNVTDGGHMENLGVYELLRRRCKVIIAADAEADPGMCFSSLSRVIRYARTDLGIDIDLNVDTIRPDFADTSKRAHFAIATITYPGGFAGHFIYLKSTLVGSEDLYVRQQKGTDDPEFPHTPTSDQFFTEAQFECYRALGFHVGNRVFRDWSGREGRTDSPEWVRALEMC